MKSFLSSLHKLDSSAHALRDRTASSRQYPLFTTLLLSGAIIGSSIGLMAAPATAAPLDATKIYVVSGSSVSTVTNIGSINLSTGAITPVFTTGVANTAALGFDPTTLNLYYSDRNLNPNNLRRYDGTTESSSLGNFTGSSAAIPILRMGFRGSTGYAISNDNTIYTFTTGTTPTITNLGLLNFLGTSPSGVTSSGDVAFDGYGRGWAIFGNSLYRLNLVLATNTYQAIPIGQLTVGGVPLVPGTPTIGSIAFDAAGDLYVAGFTGTTTSIYKVNVDDATATLVGSPNTVVTDLASAYQPFIDPTIKANKTVSPSGSALPGSTLTYSIDVENTGNAPAVNVQVVDALPAGVTYVANTAKLNGTSIGAAGATYPFGTPYTVTGRTASAGTLKVGNANRATISFDVTINTTNLPNSIQNQGTITYLDNPAGGIPTSTASTPVTSPVTGYKSVKLTNDVDNSGTITPGDTVTWTISYKNQSTVAVNSFQINDPLPTGVTLTPTGGQTVTVSGTGTNATKNTAYTGASTGAVSNILNTATLNAGGVVTVNIPTVVTSGFTGTLSNQPNATGSSIPGTGTLTDNVDNTTSVPTGVIVPTGSVTQTQTATIDPTKITVQTAAVITPFKDRINSCGLITFDSNSEGFRAATITDSGTNYNAFTISPKSAPFTNSSGTFNWQSIGNPGGSIFTDDLDGQWTIFTTPDFGTDTNFSFLNSKSLTFDYKNDTGISGDYDFWVALVGKNGQKVFYSFKTQLSGASTTAFSKVVVPMNASQWFTTFQSPTSAAPTSTAFTDILSNLDRIDIGAEGKLGPDRTEIDNMGIACDRGDAPNTYGTLAAANGPSHQIISALKLGTKIDAENDGQPTPNANGDDQDLSASNRIGVIDDEDGITAFPTLTAGGTNYSIPAANITAVNTTGGAATLHAWIDFNKNGTFEATEYTATTINTSGAATGPLSWNTGFTIGSSGTTVARFRLTKDTSIIASTPGGLATDGEVEDYQVSISAAVVSNPNVLLVKRITAINGDRLKNPNDNTPLNVVVNDTTTSDNNANWPNPTSGTPPISTYLQGVIDAGKVKPGDTIEYTIYFLNAGGGNASNVRVCDRITGAQKFPSGSTIQLQQNSATPTALTSSDDTDRATFYASSSNPAITNCNFTGTPTIDNGAIVVDVTGATGSPTWTTLPGSTGPSTANTYGLVRFTTKVNP